MIFDLLECYSVTETDWMTEKATVWPESLGYQKFLTFVENLKVVNDLAERGIKLVGDNIDKSADEAQIQALLQVVEWLKDNFKNCNNATLE